MRGELREREDTAGITIGLSLSSGATVESSDSRRRSSAFVRFNVFPRPVCPLWSSHSPDFDRLICRLLTSFSLFRFYSLSAFLSPFTSLFLFPLSRCRSLSDLPAFSVFLSFSYFNLLVPRQFSFRLPRSSTFSPSRRASLQSSRRLSLFFHVWQPFVSHCASSPWKELRGTILAIVATNFQRETFGNLIINYKGNTRASTFVASRSV